MSTITIKKPTRSRVTLDDRASLELLDHDRAIFTRGNRVYRLSNLSNNHLVGKLIVMIKAYVCGDGSLGHCDRINLMHLRSRNQFANYASKGWRIGPSTIKADMACLLEKLIDNGFVR